jgi:hypothetical protein
LSFFWHEWASLNWPTHAKKRPIYTRTRSIFADYIQPITLAEVGDTVEGMPAIAVGWGQISDCKFTVRLSRYIKNLFELIF